MSWNETPEQTYDRRQARLVLREAMIEAHAHGVSWFSMRQLADRLDEEDEE